MRRYAHTPMAERPTDHAVVLLLWAIGLGLTLYAGVARPRPVGSVALACLYVSFESLILWWLLRELPAAHHWKRVLAAAGFAVLLLVVNALFRPLRYEMGWFGERAYSNISYQLLVSVTFLGYAVLTAVRTRQEGSGSRRAA